LAETTAAASAAPAAEDPQGRWAALAVLAVAIILSMTTWFSATAVLPQLRERWDLSTQASSWLTISVQIGFVVGAIVSAALNLADVTPPRRLILYGAAGAAGANALLVVSGGLASAIVFRGLTGAFLALVYPPSLKAMATWFRAGRGTALGVMVGALTLGSATPHLVNGIGGLDADAVILATSLLTLAGGFIAEFLGRDGPFPFPTATFDPRLAGRILRSRPVMLASTGYFGHMWELYAMWAWFRAFMVDDLTSRGWSDPETAASLITFAVIGVGAVGCWVGGVIGDRWGRAESTIVAMTFSGLCAATIGLAGRGSLALVVVIGLVWGFWVVADSAQFSAVVTEVAEQRYVGSAVTLQLALGFTLTVVTIWLVPVVRDGASWAWAFVMLAAGPFLGIVAMARLRPVLRDHPPISG
jgi:MFS family permease